MPHRMFHRSHDLPLPVPDPTAPIASPAVAACAAPPPFMNQPSPVTAASADRALRDQADERLRRRAAVAFGILVIVLVTWPMVKAGLAALHEEWGVRRATGAVLNLRVDDVGRLTPLVGPYSRFGWNHPGPLLSGCSRCRTTFSAGDQSPSSLPPA